MNKFSPTNGTFGTDTEQNSTDEINLREIVFKYLGYWKWFLVSIALFLTLGALVYLKTQRKYDVSTSVLLKEDKGSGVSSGALGSLGDLGLLSSTSNIDNEIAIFSSPNLFKQAVLDLGLYTSYFKCGFFRDTEVYKDCPFFVNMPDINPEELKGGLELDVNLTKDGSVAINGDYVVNKEKFKVEGKLDKLPGFIELPQELGRLYIDNQPVEASVEVGDKYKVYIQNAQYLAYDLASEISIGSTTKKSSALTIGLTVLNVQKGIAFLNKIVSLYNANNVQDNNEIAKNTSSFIDERLKVISKELGDIEGNVVAYKQQQGITDIGAEAKIFVEQTSDLEQRRVSIETQIKTIEFVEDFIRNKNNEYKFIPNLGITDPGLSKVIAEYNDFLLEYQRLEQSVSDNSPSKIKALQDLNNTRESIQGAVFNIKKALNISKNEIGKQFSQIASRVRSVPAQEMGLLEVTRQQEIKQALYLFLMKTKEETNITMASTSDKAKVITDPIIPKSPISPRRSIIMLASLLLGIIIPAGVIYLKDTLKATISDKQELEKLSKVPVIGEIMKKAADDKPIVVNSGWVTPIAELFRALRNHLQFILGGTSNNKKVILVTSTIPGEGKTFVSINLAASFALLDKKVLLVGTDIRNPRLALDLEIKKGAGLTSFLSGSESDWRSMLVNLKGFPKFDVLQAGVIPPNPNELLMKSEMSEFINQARQEYDIVILDSAPVGVISDTFLLSHMVDTTLYVTREDVTPKQAVNFINSLPQEDRLVNMYLVYNGADLSKNKGKYGYGHTYGYANKK